jgi:hypothetical protein
MRSRHIRHYHASRPSPDNGPQSQGSYSQEAGLLVHFRLIQQTHQTSDQTLVEYQERQMDAFQQMHQKNARTLDEHHEPQMDKVQQSDSNSLFGHPQHIF